MSDPWYKDGLSFTCTRCGKCCTGAPGFVWVNDEEIQAIADFIGVSTDEFRGRHARLEYRGYTLREKVNGDCIFFDRAKGCTVYPVRPRQCRTWPFWESNIATEEAWENTRAICPGSGNGELIQEEEITRRMRVIRL
jgi:uncharacterized protein